MGRSRRESHPERLEKDVCKKRFLPSVGGNFIFPARTVDDGDDGDDGGDVGKEGGSLQTGSTC
ncbi:hypothetical protein ColTof4_02264 [Colletotrichum tofieldiae]|nr:hypothetical protein ColTof3_09449 [Colletotrichum tofieldiae]GKT69841.1 hypothetical protein ColTof4_02264 [Colletotrichum tofieldiae]GKT92859.1 hypothetical protein Ct61P_10709 [Colletotrichum tofieldiae]